MTIDKTKASTHDIYHRFFSVGCRHHTGGGVWLDRRRHCITDRLAQLVNDKVQQQLEDEQMNQQTIDENTFATEEVQQSSDEVEKDEDFDTWVKRQQQIHLADQGDRWSVASSNTSEGHTSHHPTTNGDDASTLSSLSSNASGVDTTTKPSSDIEPEEDLTSISEQEQQGGQSATDNTSYPSPPTPGDDTRASTYLVSAANESDAKAKLSSISDSDEEDLISFTGEEEHMGDAALSLIVSQSSIPPTQLTDIDISAPPTVEKAHNNSPVPTDDPITDLERECFYLNLAMKRLRKQSPEWSFLNMKYTAAKEELEAVLQDRDLTFSADYKSDFRVTIPTQDDDNSSYGCSLESFAPSSVESIIPRSISLVSILSGSTKPKIAGDVSYSKMSHTESDGDVESAGEDVPLHTVLEEPMVISPPRKRFRREFTIWTVVSALVLFILVFFSSFKIVPRKDDSGVVESSVSFRDASSNSLMDEPSQSSCAVFAVRLVTDSYGNETRWELGAIRETRDDSLGEMLLVETKENSGRSLIMSRDGKYANNRMLRELVSREVVLAGGPYSYKQSDNEVISASICLPVGKYEFVIYDTEFNGLCCTFGEGKYGLQLPGKREIRPFSLGSFTGQSEVTAFEVTDIDVGSMQYPLPESLDTNEDSPLGDASNDPQSPLSLSTTTVVDVTEVSSKSFGILFDVDAKTTSSLVLSGVDLNICTASLKAASHYEVWSKRGSWEDVDEARQDYFEGFSQLSHVFRSSEGGPFRHEMKRNIVQASNTDLNVYYGAAVLKYPLQTADVETDFFDNAGFVGKVWYTKQ
ncbi:predicted protein [Thalassiosira pseudonana CCMP1335]|uniref:Uncharacterized protein n=1 Tax=Thalassiosira pseudonana TaxID=35128 RepID=B8CDL3_THAPS|nr:predicted protein [Thalassiosira pseudonana CCMP1335]EED88621.1 predicted protein [Thalassiosira pseudonana CCMP1335]